jgi:GNAT superfamily N-acetyltransferase
LRGQAAPSTKDGVAAPLPALDVGPYRPGDEGAILDCLGACFGVTRAAATWRHVYLENPAGPPIIVVAREGDAVVSHESLLPRRMTAFGRAGVAGDSIWAMTRPPWRRRGLGGSLAARAREIARERGWLAIYGFSNAQVIDRVLHHQGRRAVRPVPVMVRPLHPLAAAAAILRHAPDVAGDVAWPGWHAPTFDARHDDLFFDADALPPIAVTRDRAYLAWRYPPEDPSPYHQLDVATAGALDATLVARHASERGVRAVLVMEWVWRRGRAAAGSRLMREAIARARAGGAHAVAALAMPGTAQRAHLLRLGFLPLPGALVPAHLMLTVEALADPPNVCWTAPSSWYLTFGDGDVV